MKNQTGIEMIRKTITFIAVVLALAACSETNTRMSQQEIQSALGIVDGQVNKIRIGGVLFRIPAEYRIRFVEANEEKLKEKAFDEAVSGIMFFMDFSSWFNPPPVGPSEEDALVRVQIFGSGYEDSVGKAREFESRKWARTRDIPEWGLREYVSASFPRDTSWNVLSYRAVHAETPRGGPVIFGCTADFPDAQRNVARATVCGTGYQTLRGPTVGYRLSGKLLARWKEVSDQVVTLVDSSMVKE